MKLPSAFEYSDDGPVAIAKGDAFAGIGYENCARADLPTITSRIAGWFIRPETIFSSERTANAFAPTPRRVTNASEEHDFLATEAIAIASRRRWPVCH